jgi:hypothetical protein
VLGDELDLNVEVSPFYPLLQRPVRALLGQLGRRALTGRSTTWSTPRRSGRTCSTAPYTAQAIKRLSAMFFIQPERDRSVDESIRTYDPTVTEDDSVTGPQVIKY